MRTRNRWFVTLSLVYGLLGGLVGLTRLIDPTLLPGDVARAHGHMMLLGFFLMFIYGVALHVVPRFAGSPLYSEALADWQFYAANAGLPLMVGGWFFSIGWMVGLGAVLSYSAIVLFVANLMFSVRIKRPVS